MDMFCCKKNTHKKRLEEASKIIESRNSGIQKFLQKLKFSDPKIDSKLKELIIKKTITEQRLLVITEFISCVDLLKIFLERSYTVGFELGALADTCHERALLEAELRDRQLKDCPKINRMDKLGPLFGVPISIKESIKMNGTYSSLGFIAFSGEQFNQQQDSIPVKQIIRHGGVPFVKSNVPMFLMTWECSNHIFGTTSNPWNTARVPGGSSGGEGCLIASHCSPGGIGTDIGGSIRIPCSYCGLYGMKYTGARVATTHSFTPGPSGRNGGFIKSVIGPMTRSADDQIAMTHALLDLQSYFECPEIKYKPLDIERINKTDDKLTIAYVESLPSILNACPTAIRAVKESVEIIKSMGHKVVKMEYDFAVTYEKTARVFTAGKRMQDLPKLLQGEDPLDIYRVMLQANQLPSYVIKLLVKLFTKDPRRLNYVLENANKNTTTELCEFITLLEQEQIKLKKHFIENKIDLLIMPTLPTPAMIKKTANSVTPIAVSYCTIWNGMDFPAGTIPYTLVQENEQYFEDMYDDRIREGVSKNMVNSKGLPIGLQVIGLPNHDELVLNFMKRFESEFQKIKEVV